jgi:hypothetical protein
MALERDDLDDDDVSDLVDLMKRYRGVVAHLIQQPRDTPDYGLALEEEIELSRAIHREVARLRAATGDDHHVG